jgi:hypothetical protein
MRQAQGVILMNTVIEIFPQIKSTIRSAVTLYTRTTPVVVNYRLEKEKTLTTCCLLSTLRKRPAAAFSRQGFISPKIDWVSPINKR